MVLLVTLQYFGVQENKMQQYKYKSVSGKEIVFLVPETPEDHEFLRKNEEAGKISSKASFGDWKLVEKKNEDTKPE